MQCYEVFFFLYNKKSNTVTSYVHHTPTLWLGTRRVSNSNEKLSFTEGIHWKLAQVRLRDLN